MSLVAYPTEFPEISIREIIRLVRQGQVTAQRTEAALHLWNIQGYIQSIVLGQPSPKNQIGPTDIPTSSLVDLLEAALEDHADSVTGFSGPSFPWMPLLLLVIERVVEILRRRDNAA